MGTRRRRTRQWHARHVADPHVRAAAKLGYRSRAALKLAALDDRAGLLAKAGAVVDLGASPGSWSQVALERAPAGAKVVAVDVLPIEPLEGVEIMRADILDAGLDDALAAAAGGRDAVVISDAAPDVSGVRDRDDEAFIDLHEAVARIALRLGAAAVLMKTFTGAPAERARERLAESFGPGRFVRPEATKKRSRECYLVAKRTLRH